MQLSLKATDMVMVDMPYALNGKAVNMDRQHEVYDTMYRPPPSPASSGNQSPAAEGALLKSGRGNPM